MAVLFCPIATGLVLAYTGYADILSKLTSKPKGHAAENLVTDLLYKRRG